jgi:hypothetical protein
MKLQERLFSTVKRAPELFATKASVPIVSVPKEIQLIELLKFCQLIAFPDGRKENTCGELTRYHLASKTNSESQ